MKAENIKPVPKYIIAKIYRKDKRYYPEQQGNLRFYSYLTTIKKELVKITVAVKNHRKRWYCKQVTLLSIKSNKCFAKDIQYNCYGMGSFYRVGWHHEGLTKDVKWYEDNLWYEADVKYFNPKSFLINREYVGKFPEYKYSVYLHFQGGCIIKYLKLYEKYPQVEYLMKLGLWKFYNSVTILKRIAKDKKFCKWLIANRNEIVLNHCYVEAVLKAYKTGKSITQIQSFLESKKQFEKDSCAGPIRELLRGDLERFFLYLEKQKITTCLYLDYLNACNYLGLDMTLPKNRYPHNFKHWHDVRIDEYHSAKASADEKERAELYEKFSIVAQKYMPLQNSKNGYAIVIANSPTELLHEGRILRHCVGKMGYDQKMVREEILIFFVRDINSPDTPFITVEYSLKSKKILQAYGYFHSKPDDNADHFINKVWLPYANKTMKKLAVQAA